MSFDPGIWHAGYLDILRSSLKVKVRVHRRWRKQKISNWLDGWPWH